MPFISRHDVGVGELTCSETPLENAPSTSGSRAFADGGSCSAVGACKRQDALCRPGGNTFEERVNLAHQSAKDEHDPHRSLKSNPAGLEPSMGRDPAVPKRTRSGWS